MYCGKCGAQLNDVDRVCPSCGEPTAVRKGSTRPPVRSAKKKLLTGITVIIAAIYLVVHLSFILFMISLFVHHYSTKINAQSRFEAEVETVLPDALPLPLDLDSPKTVVLHKYRTNSLGIFQSRSCTLLCRYDEAEYTAAKAALEARYRFRTEPLDSGSSDPENHLIEPYVKIGNDQFRFLYPGDDDENAWAFYKRSILIVTNDVEQEIGYIVFEDIDLDVAENLTEFINERCGWKYIRK